MKYPREFFEINLRFAWKVSEITQEPIERMLLYYTNFYIRFGIGRDFAIANPIWQQYLESLNQVEDIAEWTYRFYLNRQQHISLKSNNSPCSCFPYSVVDGNRIRLHFHNNESPEHSPLSHDQMGKRLSELKSIFAQIKQEENSPTNVIGASWLYNLEAYYRLFPPAYLATAQVSGNDFPYLTLWGQFIDHHGRIKESLVMQFIECLDKQHWLEYIGKCFPFQVLHLESSIREFYKFYHV